MQNLSFSEAVVRKCSIQELLLKFFQSSLATLFKKRLRHRCIAVSEIMQFCEIAVNMQMTGSGFCTVLHVSLHDSFHQAEQ